MSGLRSLTAQAGLERTGQVVPTRESVAWLVRQGELLAVLRRLDPARYAPQDPQAGADLAWLHQFLSALTDDGFPAPRPVTAFDGESWVRHEGAIWELVTYLPGDMIGWDPSPSLVEVGALLARYHDASGRIEGSLVDQRPRAFPLDRLVHWQIDAKHRPWQDVLAADLERIGHHQTSTLIIHADFTTHNVVASGHPAAPSGVIDFALAYREASLADIGFGLWRTGRPFQDSISIDRHRVQAFVRGYQQIRPLTAASADAIAVYTRARGIQQMVKQHHNRARRPLPLLHERVAWLAAHHDVLVEWLSDTIQGGR